MFKNGDTSNINNYRPISILPSISKIVEYVIFHQFFYYMSHNALFCQEQFGVRTGYSTELASLQLTDYLIKQMDQGSTPLNIYIYIYILISQRPLTPLIILFYCRNWVIMESQAVRINFLWTICPTDINMLNTIMHNLWQN